MADVAIDQIASLVDNEIKHRNVPQKQDSWEVLLVQIAR